MFVLYTIYCKKDDNLRLLFFTKNVIFFYTFPAFLQALPEFNEAQLLT